MTVPAQTDAVGENRGVDDSTRKLADTLRAISGGPGSTFRNCIVDHVVTGGASDGGDALFIKVGDDVLPSNYLGSAPPAGATVRVEFCEGSPIVHGRVLGNPAL